MNVLMITRDDSVLDEKSAAHALVKEQAKLVNRFVVIVMNSRVTRHPPRKVSDSLWLFATNSLFPFLKVQNALYIVRHEIFFRNRLQSDIVVGGDPTFAGLAAYFVALRHRKTLHIHVDGDPFSLGYALSSFSNFFRSVFAILMVRYATTLSVTSERARVDVVRLYRKNADRVYLIPPYRDIEAIQSDTSGEDLHLKYTQFRAIMLVVAPLTSGQDIEIAIRSLAELSKYYPNLGLVIVGRGPHKGSLRRYARHFGVERSVIFEPPRENLISYYKTAQFLMVPAPTEESDKTVEDAAIAGCPIISAPAGYASLIIENGKNGFLCNPREPSEFWNAAGALIRNLTTRSQFKENILATMRARMNTTVDDIVQMHKKAWDATQKAANA